MKYKNNVPQDFGKTPTEENKLEQTVKIVDDKVVLSSKILEAKEVEVPVEEALLQWQAQRKQLVAHREKLDADLAELDAMVAKVEALITPA